MVNLTISLSEETVRKLRKTIRERFAGKRGSLSGLIEESLREKLDLFETPPPSQTFRALKDDSEIAEAKSLDDLAKKLEKYGRRSQIGEDCLFEEIGSSCEGRTSRAKSLSGFLNLTPAVQIVLENPFFRKTYPLEGSVTAIIDTGYEGFLSVPRSIFQELALNRLEGERRDMALADGSLISTEGSYGTFRIPHLSIRVDGFVETFPRLDEIILGVEALSNFKVVLDYCTRKIGLEECLR